MHETIAQKAVRIAKEKNCQTDSTAYALLSKRFPGEENQFEWDGEGFTFHYGKDVFKLVPHVDRFHCSCRGTFINWVFDIEGLGRAIREKIHTDECWKNFFPNAFRSLFGLN